MQISPGKDQISTEFMYIEDTKVLPILQVREEYHNTFQIVGCVMKNLQKIRLAKNVNFVPVSPILIYYGYVMHIWKKSGLSKVLILINEYAELTVLQRL